MSKYKIVFDNQCAACSLGIRSLTRMGLMNSNSSIELESFMENDIACNVDPIRACDEMAVINKDTLEVSYGYDGYVNLFIEKYPILGKIMRNRVIKWIFNPYYLFFASNRRILAPLTPTETTCQPTLKKNFRFGLIFLVALYAGVITYIKGGILQNSEWFSFLSPWKLISITGLGWLITGLLYNGKEKWDYWGHLSVIAGTAIFIQTIALVGYYFFPSFFWVIGSMLLSDFVMIWLHYKRIKLIGESQKQTIIWWLILHLSALALITFYFLQ